MCGERDRQARQGANGMLRGLLKLLVEIDSSRFLTTRAAAALGLIALLAAFGAVGYWLPAAIAGYFGH